MNITTKNHINFNISIEIASCIQHFSLLSLVVSSAGIVTFCLQMLNLVILVLLLQEDNVAWLHWSPYPHVLSFSLVLQIQRAKQKLFRQNTQQLIVSKILLLLVIVRRVQAKNSSQLCCLSSRLSSSESAKFGSLPHMKAALIEVIILNGSDLLEFSKTKVLKERASIQESDVEVKVYLSYKWAASSWEEKVPKWICLFSTLMAACHFMFL